MKRMNKKELYMFKRYFHNDRKVRENGLNKISTCIIINTLFVILCTSNCKT